VRLNNSVLFTLTTVTSTGLPDDASKSQIAVNRLAKNSPRRPQGYNGSDCLKPNSTRSPVAVLLPTRTFRFTLLIGSGVRKLLARISLISGVSLEYGPTVFTTYRSSDLAAATSSPDWKFTITPRLWPNCGSISLVAK